MNNLLGFRGVVLLEEVLDGRVIQRRLLDNTLTYFFRTQVIRWLAGKGVYNAVSNPLGWVLPAYMGIGVGTVGGDQKAVTALVSEVFRNSLAIVPQMSTTSTVFRVVFKAEDIAVSISEVMMFEQDASVVLLDSCQVLGTWQTGTLQTLVVDATDRRQGSGSLKATVTGAGPSNRSFYQDGWANIDCSAADIALQAWLSVTDKTKLTSDVTIRLYSVSTANYWSWTVTLASLVNGWNFINLLFSAASTTGSPVTTDIIGFELLVAKDNGAILNLDYIRTYQHAGTGLSRVEVSPVFVKQIGSILNIVWTVFPVV